MAICFSLGLEFTGTAGFDDLVLTGIADFVDLRCCWASSFWT
jgi:hypothetical protein